VRPGFLVLIAATVVILDQITKYLVYTYMQVGQSIPLLGKWLSLTYIHNLGGAFGVLQGKRWLFLATGWGVTAALCYYLPRIARLNRWSAISYALILGGAIGNLYDRTRYGYVVDFVEVALPGPWGQGFSWVKTFPCFNVADSGITVGITFLLLYGIFSSEKKDEPAEPSLEEPQPQASATIA